MPLVSYASIFTSDVFLPLSPRIMFFSDDDEIERAFMDGRNRQAVVSDGIYRAYGLTVDHVTRRIYWVDSLIDYIGTVDYDGKDR